MDKKLKHEEGAYGVEGVETLHSNRPDFLLPGGWGHQSMVSDQTDWVDYILSRVTHVTSPAIRTSITDMTNKTKGYVKTKEKEISKDLLVGRETYSTTIYTKRKIDRDDWLDLGTNGDAVTSYYKNMLRKQLRVDLANAILLGDLRPVSDPLKIDQTKLRPVFGDTLVYAYPNPVTNAVNVLPLISEGRYGMYAGSGNPTLFVNPRFIGQLMTLGTSTILQPDLVKKILQVEDIIVVPEFLNGINRNQFLPNSGVLATGANHSYNWLNPYCIMFNPRDYILTTPSETNEFESFDIDSNTHTAVMETRVGGALSGIFSALSAYEWGPSADASLLTYDLATIIGILGGL